MRKMVTLSNIPAGCYYCGIHQFIENNQSKPLEVVWETREFIRVRDAEGDEVSLQKEHVNTVAQHRTIGSELTFSRRNS
jgi:SH3-like domain-containing protein